MSNMNLKTGAHMNSTARPVAHKFIVLQVNCLGWRRDALASHAQQAMTSLTPKNIALHSMHGTPARPALLLRRRGSHRQRRWMHMHATAMVNVDVSPSVILGVGLIGAGVSLWQIRQAKPWISKDYDVVVACISLLVGGILIFQGWRLDPLLLFGQLMTTGAAVSFGIEALRLRSQVYEQDEKAALQDAFRRKGRPGSGGPKDEGLRLPPPEPPFFEEGRWMSEDRWVDRGREPEVEGYTKYYSTSESRRSRAGPVSTFQEEGYVDGRSGQYVEADYYESPSYRDEDYGDDPDGEGGMEAYYRASEQPPAASNEREDYREFPETRWNRGDASQYGTGEDWD